MKQLSENQTFHFTSVVIFRVKVLQFTFWALDFTCSIT